MSLSTRGGIATCAHVDMLIVLPLFPQLQVFHPEQRSIQADSPLPYAQCLSCIKLLSYHALEQGGR